MRRPRSTTSGLRGRAGLDMQKYRSSKLRLNEFARTL
jgi:hypothetical protein